MRKFRMAALFLVLCLSSPAGFSASEEPTFVSLIQLIANPEKYEHKLIAVTGFLQLEFESSRMYLGREDFQNQLVANSICIESNSAMDKEADKLNQTYVVVFGTFSSSHCGTDNFKMGRVAHISKYFRWPSPKGTQ